MPGVWRISYSEVAQGLAKVHAVDKVPTTSGGVWNVHVPQVFLDVAQGLAKVHAVDKVPTISKQKPDPDHRDYLALATKSTERMQKMLESAGIHPTQCKYLVTKLESALASLSRKPEHRAQCLEVLKLLYRLAVEVESFVRDCCVVKPPRFKEKTLNKKHSEEEQPVDLKWHRTAITLANVSQRVSVLSHNLHFCTLVLRRSSIFEWSPSLTGLDIEVCKGEVDLLKESAKSDQEKLLDTTNTLLSAYRLNVDTLLFNTGYDLARHLLRRLTALGKGEYRHLSYGALSKWLGNSDGTMLGKGASGEVKKVRWQGEDVAVKGFSVNEISILASLSHPSIVSVLGYATENRERTVIMLELMNGGDLFKFMEGRRKTRGCNPPFSIFEAVDIMLQIGGGVEFLHENKVMHRDLKSPNVLVKCLRDEDDVEFVFVKLADFEQSTMEGLRCTHSPINLEKTGTTRWMAPEVIPNDKEHLPCEYDIYKSDVHSFGMVCYEILTGEIPFSELGNKMKEVKSKIKEGERPLLPAECPEDLKTLIERCWDPIPSARPSFTEICVELRKVKFALMTGVKFEDACVTELSKELVYLLKQNGGKMILSKVRDEYNKQFGRNLPLPKYTSLLQLVQKMKETLVVKDENRDKILHMVQNTPRAGNKNIKKRNERKV